MNSDKGIGRKESGKAGDSPEESKDVKPSPRKKVLEQKEKS